MRSCIAALLVAACGVEETGYLTDEGVYFTSDDEQGVRVLVVRPEAVTELGGTLELVTFEGERQDDRTLDEAGVAWVLGPTEGATLTYSIDGQSESTDRPFALAQGPPPAENAVALGAPWVQADGAGLAILPSSLLGDLPWLVVNQANGASILVEDTAEQRLDGGAGDRVCVSALEGDELTASTCRVASAP